MSEGVNEPPILYASLPPFSLGSNFRTIRVPFTHEALVTFTHARKERIASIQFGWFPIRLPDTKQQLWMLVAHEKRIRRTLTLLTNVPLHSIEDVRSVYDDWRLRTRIEHGYRFDQEQGLDVEDMRVRKLERMKRLQSVPESSFHLWVITRPKSLDASTTLITHLCL